MLSRITEIKDLDVDKIKAEAKALFKVLDEADDLGRLEISDTEKDKLFSDLSDRANGDYGKALVFDTGFLLFTMHDPNCCESHEWCLDDLSLNDFKGLTFDINEKGDFFERVDGFGIRLLPVNGFPISIPCHGYNNGYYGSDITLVLENTKTNTRYKFDISDCQSIVD